MPLTLILTTFLLALFLRRKSTTALAIITFIGFTNPFLANVSMKIWEHPGPGGEALPKTAVVLTGVMKPQKSLDVLPSFRRGGDRATHAVELYKQGLIEKIILTGGDASIGAKTVPEALVIEQFMIRMGVKPLDISVEQKARNTRENALFTLDLLKKNQSEEKPLLLITSAFHMRRALACYRKVGLAVTPFVVDIRSYDPTPDLRDWLFPSADALLIWERMIKEWLGFIAYWLMGYL